MGYLSLEEKEYLQAITIYKQYIDLDRNQSDNENEHIGIHQLAMVYRELGEYTIALDLINQEEKIIRQYFCGDI